MTHDKNSADTHADPANHQAFIELYDRLRKPIYNFFANRGCTRDQARDLRQDTFAEAFGSFDGFRGDSQPVTWIFGVAKRVWQRQMRDRDRLKRRGIEVSIDEGDDPEAPSSLKSQLAADDCPFEDAARAEQSRLMHEALEELPTNMRRCMLLRLDQDLEYRQIADVLQIDIGQVKSQLSRGKGRLQKILQDHRAEAR